MSGSPSPAGAARVSGPLLAGGAVPTGLHLPESPCGRRGPLLGSSPLRDLVLRFPLTRLLHGRAEGRARAPRQLGRPAGRCRRGGSGPGRGGARRQESTCEQGAAALGAWAAAALRSKLQ